MLISLSALFDMSPFNVNYAQVHHQRQRLISHPQHRHRAFYPETSVSKSAAFGRTRGQATKATRLTDAEVNIGQDRRR